MEVSQNSVLDTDPCSLRTWALYLSCVPSSPDDSGEPCSLLFHCRTREAVSAFPKHCYQPLSTFSSSMILILMHPSQGNIFQPRPWTRLPANPDSFFKTECKCHLLWEASLTLCGRGRGSLDVLCPWLLEPLSYHCSEMTFVYLSVPEGQGWWSLHI